MSANTTKSFLAGGLKGTRAKNFLLDHIIEVLLVILVVGLWIASPNFMTVQNWLNIFRSSALKGVIAFGMTMVIIAGQIDLSVGSTVALAGVIVARACRDLTAMGMNVNTACIIGILLALLAAVVMGIIHGYSQHKFGMPAFIVTLASQNFLYGLAGIVCAGFPISNQFPEWFNQLGVGRVGGQNGIPIPAIIMMIVFGLIYFLMKYTTTGRTVYAVGGNPESARLSGINVLKSKTICFVICQVLATIGGLMNSAQVRAGSFSFGRGWETDVITSVVIGGTSMAGGIGNIWGTLMGVIFLGVMTNGMTILNFSVYAQYVIRGLLMFAAVLISTYQLVSKGKN